MTMRKPSLNLDLDSKITNMIARERRNKRRQLVTYILKVLESKGLDFDTMETSLLFEKVKFYSIDILTLRINGKIVMQEFPNGTYTFGLVGRSYKLFLETFFDKDLQD